MYPLVFAVDPLVVAVDPLVVEVAPLVFEVDPLVVAVDPLVVVAASGTGSTSRTGGVNSKSGFVGKFPKSSYSCLAIAIPFILNPRSMHTAVERLITDVFRLLFVRFIFESIIIK